MKLLCIKAHQVMANYKKPMCYGFIDSYPLPPISTIKGWFHAVINAKEYIPISMSIQGNSSSVVYDLQRMIKFDRDRILEKTAGIDFDTFHRRIIAKIANEEDKELIKSLYSYDSKKKEYIRKGTKELPIKFKEIMKSISYPKPYLEDHNKMLSYSPTYVANVFNIDLLIYISADKCHLDKFKERVFTIDYPHIGRNEDLTRIDSVKYVDVKEKSFGMQQNHSIDYGVYLNRSTTKKMSLIGSKYRMPFKYEVANGIRYFNRLDVVYIEDGAVNIPCLFDYEENRIIDLIGDYNGT